MQHYHFVVTPFLNQTARNAVQGPQLILYRSIQGTWEEFNHFDWEHHNGKRIITRWNS